MSRLRKYIRSDIYEAKMTEDFYSASAQGYDELYGKEQQEKLSEISDFIMSEDIDISGNILDVGCGSGISASYFGCSVGIDPCNELLDIAKEKHKEIKFIKASAEEIPFPDNAFDFSVSITAAQNFSDMHKAISEINRVSRKGFIITILRNSPKRQMLESELRSFGAKISSSEQDKDAIFLVRKR